MKSLAFLVFTILVANASYGLSVGEEAPSFAPSGQEINASEFKGKIVYLDFWASWCGPCKRSFPWMQTLQQRFGSRGLKIVAVNVDENRSEADKFLRDIPVGFMTLFDPKGEIPPRFQLAVMPSSFLIDRSGKVVFIQQGFSEEDEKELEKKIETTLSEEKKS